MSTDLVYNNGPLCIGTTWHWYADFNVFSSGTFDRTLAVSRTGLSDHHTAGVRELVGYAQKVKEEDPKEFFSEFSTLMHADQIHKLQAYDARCRKLEEELIKARAQDSIELEDASICMGLQRALKSNREAVAELILIISP